MSDVKSIYLGSDHAGFRLKEEIQQYLKGKDYHVVDLGVFEEVSSDYPDIAREVAEKVSENKNAFGILMCGTGIGMCMAANKVKGVRAANAESVTYAEMARRHNDANILCLGGRHISFEKAREIIDTFFSITFEAEERHVRRVEKVG